MATRDDVERLTRMEVSAISDMRRRALTECWNKCVPHIKDGELAIGEMTCVDRCVPKYFQVHTMVRDQYMAMNKAKEDQKRLREAFASAKNGVGGTADN